MNKLGTQPTVNMPQSVVTPTPIAEDFLTQRSEDIQAAIAKENKKSTFPTVIVDLPSKGLLYPQGHPLASGTVEMKYMTAKEEDILTTESYIKSNIVFDKLFQSLLVTPFEYESLIAGDRDAIMIAARIHGYGEVYNVKVTAPSGEELEVGVDLNDLKPKQWDESAIVPHNNSFAFELPMSKAIVEFKILTVGDGKQLESKGSVKKYKTPGSPDHNVTERLSKQILSINGESDPNFIKLFVNNELRAMDSIALRRHIASLTPGINMEIELEDPRSGEPFRTSVSIGLDFFWPDFGV